MIARREIKVDGIRLSYLESGQATKSLPSLVLVHGLMACAEIFVPLMRSLHENLHAVALDLPSAGQSEGREDIDASLHCTAELVAHTLDALQIERPVLLGHSHGGAVALSLAAHRSADLRGMILLSPAHPYYRGSEPLIRFYLSMPGRIFAYAMPWLPQWLWMIGLHRMAGPNSEDTREHLRPYRDNLRHRGTIAHLLNLIRTWAADMDCLRHLLHVPLHTPALILWGDCDHVVPLQSAAQLRQHLSQSEMIVLEGTGHRPAEEVPQLVAGFIRVWMGKLEKASTLHIAHQSPNSSAIHARMAPLMPSSFEPGDSGTPVKKWSAPSIQTIRLGSAAEASTDSSTPGGLNWS